MMLRRGDSVPHFEVRSLTGARVNYSTIWQRRNLLLLVMAAIESEATRAYAADVTNRFQEFRDQDVECVVTRDAIDGVPSPGVLVADRWGEVAFAAAAKDVAGLPRPAELIEWLRYTLNRCPECEGEAQ
jgi:hypothetical protein